MKDFASTLKHLFKDAYPAESMASTVILQCFLTGLCPEIGCQLLLCNRPTTFIDTLKDAEEIEYALIWIRAYMRLNTRRDSQNILIVLH